MSQTDGALPVSSVGRRLSAPPSRCNTNVTCPAVFELEDGNFAVVGTHRTEEMRERLPDDAGVAPYEDVVIVPRDIMLAATKALMLTLLVAMACAVIPRFGRNRSGRRQPSSG